MEDHPRVCGEYAGCSRAIYRGLESPPRVRGIPSTANYEKNASGITPACAGNTSRISTVLTWPRDHPRVCGEY